jgi:hypothetical protein
MVTKTRELETGGNQAAVDEITKKVKIAKENALEMMKKAGYDIGDVVQVMVDPQLPFMGYTMPRGNDKYRIVVSGGSVDSGLLEGLLVHEMSHVYRMKTRHLSHNGQVIEEAVNSFGKNVAKYDYQQKIMHDMLNDIQDLYADDLSFKVLRQSKILPIEDMTSFLQDWVKDEPSSSGDERKDRWINAGIMVHNARAIAQMERHKVPDTGNKAAKTNKEFLAKLPHTISGQFEYFRNLLRNLDENLTEDSYRALLHNYLSKFLEIAEKN